MVTKTVTVTAKDKDGSQIKAVITFTLPRTLVPYEHSLIKQVAARRIAAILSDLPYTDFGAENTTVKM